MFLLHTLVNIVDTYPDDWVDGKFIPKGTSVIINTWGLHFDEKRYPDPDTFNPSRYIGQMALASELAASANYENRDHYAYGAGRRLCPGIHLAERNLFLGIAKLLWAFNFAPGKDASGNAIEPDTDILTGYSEGIIVCVKPFSLEVTPRSEAIRATIMREFKQAEVDVFSKYES